LQQTVLFTS